CTTAEYRESDNKKYIEVINRCRRDSTTGNPSMIKGKAFPVKNSGNSKLKVQFFWPFRAPYWIIDLADDYSWSVVSGPSKKYLWILSRTPEMDESTYQKILRNLEDRGFDTEKLQLCKQKDCE
ncbi:MAG: lipocalin family protein, partial [Bacteroidales bacterium]|nr:lipocalin family protein [Bacteroidales bacterium]